MRRESFAHGSLVHPAGPEQAGTTRGSGAVRPVAGGPAGCGRSGRLRAVRLVAGGPMGERRHARGKAWA